MKKTIITGEMTFFDPQLKDDNFKAIVHSIDEVFCVEADRLNSKLDEIENEGKSYLVVEDYQFDVEFECEKPEAIR